MNNQKFMAVVLSLVIIASPAFVFAAGQPQLTGSPSHGSGIENNANANFVPMPANSGLHENSSPSADLHKTTLVANPTFNNSMGDNNNKGMMDNKGMMNRGMMGENDRNRGDNKNPGDFQRGDRGDRGDQRNRGDRGDRGNQRGGREFRGGHFPGERGGRYYHGGRYYYPHQFRFRNYRGFPFSSGSYLYFDPNYYTSRFFNTCFPGGDFDTSNPYCLNLFWQGWNGGRVNAWDNNKWYNPW
jgi:hypothetical protein